MKMDVADLESVKVSLYLGLSGGKRRRERGEEGKGTVELTSCLVSDELQASFNEVAGLPVVRDHGIDVLFANAGVSVNAMTTASLV